MPGAKWGFSIMVSDSRLRALYLLILLFSLLSFKHSSHYTNENKKKNENQKNKFIMYRQRIEKGPHIYNYSSYNHLTKCYLTVVS